MKKILLIVVLFCLFIFTSAQTEPGLGQIWQKNPDPFLTISGSPGTWNTGNHGYTFYGVDIIWNGSQWMLYVSGMDANNHYSIGLFTAADLFGEWTEFEGNPVFSGDGEGFDAYSVVPGAVMLDGDTYKMWYGGSASSIGSPRQTGYATSTDGINWTRLENPVLPVLPVNQWQNSSVIIADILKKEDGSYLGYFIANGAYYQVCVATSQDGITWDRSIKEPVLDSKFLGGYSSAPHVIKTDEQYVMWFYSEFETCTAVSEDGLFWRIDKLYIPTFRSGSAGSWDESALFMIKAMPYEDHFGAVLFGIGNDHPHLGWAEYNPTIVAAGDVSGTWTKAGSPIRIQGEITIPDGETLAIEPGTTVEFCGYYPLHVQGQILALGTEKEPIRFWMDDTLGFSSDTDSNGVWGSIRFDNTPSTNDSSIFSYCDIQFGKRFSDGTEWYGEYGGGAFYINRVSKLKIENCLIQYNRTVGIVQKVYASGGAIFLRNSASPEIIGNTIQNNWTLNICDNDRNSSGGGISFWDKCHPLIEGNIIRKNQCEGMGGGLSIWENSNPQIVNNLIVENNCISLTDNGVGGGIALGMGAHPVFVNNTIADNMADDFGGGFYIYEGSMTVVNTIIADNICNNGETIGSQIGYCGLSNTYNAYANFKYSCLEGGTSDIRFSNHGTTYFDATNISCDPNLLFNYTLSKYSYCIGAGTMECIISGNTIYAPNFDINGVPRPQPTYCNPDIGAFEHDHCEREVGIDPETIPLVFKLYQNYPNPFNPVTTISYDLPKSSDVSLSIYDITGRLVETLLNQNQSTGTYQVRWDASLYSSGVYFYRIQAGEFMQTQKMVVIK